MKKVILIFFILFLGILETNAQIGCAVGSNLYTSRRGASSNFNPTPVTTLDPGCYFIYASPSSACVVKASPSDLPGYIVNAIECPIDSSYLIYGFGLIISIVSFKYLAKQIR